MNAVVPFRKLWVSGRTIVYGFLLSGLLFSCVSSKERLVQLKKSEPLDVIIVPGIPFMNDWSQNEMKARVLWSWFLYSKGYTRNVIYSGSSVYSPYVEAKIMARYGEALGIPAANIFCETEALHSTENLVYGYRLARKLGFSRIAIATDPFQATLLSTFAWDFRLKITFLPFNADSLEMPQGHKIILIDPSDAFVENFIPLPERETFLERIWGTMGMKIK